MVRNKSKLIDGSENPPLYTNLSLIESLLSPKRPYGAPIKMGKGFEPTINNFQGSTKRKVDKTVFISSK